MLEESKLSQLQKDEKDIEKIKKIKEKHRGGRKAKKVNSKETREVKSFRKDKSIKKDKCIKKGENDNDDKKNKNKKSRVSDVILVVAVLVFLFSAFKLVTIFLEYNKGEKEYEQIAQAVIKEIEPSVQENDEEVEEPKFLVDFAKLQEINAETIGWIRFDEPKAISYPVVKGPDNEKYLKTTFEGKRNAAGALFVDVKNSRDFSDKNTFIYGHNMKNGTMFGQLRKFKDSSFCKANPYFYIYTPDGTYAKYQIFAVAIVKDTSDTYTRTFADEQAYMDYVNDVRSGALFSTDVEVGADSKMVSLSTCTNVRDDERLVVHGVLVDVGVAGE